ncbi:MAG: guanylate kinase [Deltaproteobacteria bacterium]|nr:guanylate kinase [Deltaproteobacteria bacterium]
MSPRGQIFVLSAPSGAGKSTVSNLVRGQLTGLTYSVSLTTRAPRPGETEGVDYHFVSREDFQARVAAGEMAEWAEVFGNLYGTSSRVLEEALAAGRDLWLEIDVDGAAQIRRRFPDGVFIFLLPPDPAELERRLKARASEDPAQVALRLSRVGGEVAQAPAYTHLVVNDRLERAVAEVLAIVTAERLRTARQWALVRGRWGC